MLGVVYNQPDNDGILPAKANTILLSTTTAGTIFGQIIFGHLADRLGRKRMYGVELLIIICTTLAQSLASSSIALNVISLLSFWRFLMGIGVGGDYPLSAVITAEMADTKWRGAMIGTVFAMQGFGQFFAAIMSLIVATGFKKTLQQVSKPGDCTGDCQRAFDTMWRIVLGFGGIPGWFALYYRLTIPETPRYTFDVKHDLEKATADSWRFRSGKIGEGKTDELKRAKAKLYMREYKRPRPTIGEFCRYFRNRKHLLVLLGTAGSWFFVDVAFYGLNINNTIILSIIGYSNNTNIYQSIKTSAIGQIVLVCAGQTPGYFFTIALVDQIGRKRILMGGFGILTLIFAVIGFCFHRLTQGSLLALYILVQFFFNFGKFVDQPLRA
jgi:PHS family inorganic phosphate transporter-like MFS transporter